MSEGSDSIFDKAKDMASKAGEAAGNVRDKVGDMVGKHEDKIDGGVDKVGDFVDDKTGGRFSEHIDKAQDATKNAVEKVAGEDDEAMPMPPASAPDDQQ